MKNESPLERFAASSRDHLAPPSQRIDGAQAKVMKDALHVIHVFLGKDYLERELDTSRSGGYLMLDGPDDQDDDEVAGLERAERVLTLAWELHGAQIIPGFDNLRPELRKRSMYEAVAEMRAVNQMCNHSDELKFIDPNAGGPTYDAEMVFNGVRVAAEVKAKIAKPVAAYRPDLVTRTLSNASRLVPHPPSPTSARPRSSVSTPAPRSWRWSQPAPAPDVTCCCSPSAR